MRKYTNTQQKSYAAGRRKINARKNPRVSSMKMKIKKGDTVMIVSGKDKGKTGKVEAVLPRENRVVVEGLNMMKRHYRRTGRQAGRVAEHAASMHASNVMLLDPETKKQTRVGRAGGNRVAKKSKTVLK